MSIRSLPGGVPEPDELFGRERLINCVSQLLEGNNIFLVAPRRFGKTGVMAYILKRPPVGYLPVYLEVEDVHDADKFAAALIAALLEHDRLRACLTAVKRLPAQLLDLVSSRIEEVRTDVFEVELRNIIKDSWGETAKALVLEMEKAEDTVVFIIDEFPQFIENVARQHGDDAARAFLQWFRSLRMRQKDRLRRFRFILGGSTGIDTILRRLDVPDKLNDFFRLPVEALSREAAERLLSALAEKYGLRFTPEAFAHVFHLISPPVPYFFHLLVSQMLLEAGFGDKKLVARDIEEVYQKRLIGPTSRAYFDYYRQRLRRYGEARERAALAILQEIANAPVGRVSSSSLYDTYRRARQKGSSVIEYDEIMADLENDWYVILDPGTNEYYFLLTTMRDWWQRYYRKFKLNRK